MSARSKNHVQIEQFVASLAQCRALDMQVVESSEAHLSMVLPYSHHIVGNVDTGVLHGGAITTLMDTASGCGTLCAFDGFELCPTLDLRVDYMRQAQPDAPVYAKASCYRKSKNIMFMRCEAYQAKQVIAQSVATFMRLGEKGVQNVEAMTRSFQPLNGQAQSGAVPQLGPPLSEVHAEALRTGSFTTLLDAIPYAGFIGVSMRDPARKLFCLADKASNVGNPTLPAIHGGVIGGFMEMSAVVHLMMSQSAPCFPKIIDFSLDYLRAGLRRETFAACEVTRQGSRVANVEVRAWQEAPDKPIALARAHFLI